MPRKPTYKELEKRIQELESAESLRNQSGTDSKANIEARMETIFKIAPIGIGVVKDRVLFEVNEFLCRMIGYHKDELIGKSARILYPSDEDYEFASKEKYHQIREKGVGTVETLFISGNRGVLNILLTSMPFDITDLSAGVTFTALDITEIKQTEKALRESEEKFSTAFRTSPYAITITRPEDGKFIDVNDSFSIITGYTREEALINSSIGLNLWVNETDRDQVVSELRQGKRIVSRELPFRRKNGEIITGLFYSHLMNHKIETFILSSINDITEQKRLESERKQKAIELEDTNTALNILLKKRDQDNQEMEKKIYANYDLMIMPFLNKLRDSLSDNHQLQLLDILETGLKEILSPFAKKLSDPMIMLTPSEIQIASMIRQGMSNKEISQILNSSIRTIETHRANIRRKLDLTNKKLNLKSYFSNI